MAWFNTNEATCIFALDYNSRVTEKGSKVFLSNKPLEYLTVSDLSSSVSNSIVSGWAVENYLPKVGGPLLYYKTLKIKKKNLIFQKTMQYPTKELTIILKLNLNSNSRFLTDIITSSPYYGLSFYEFYSYNRNLESLWHFSGLTSESILALTIPRKDRSANYRQVFDTVILRLDLDSKFGILTTNYGSVTVPLSTFDSSSFFIKSRSFKVLGSSTSEPEYYPDADIVAYGMFDKYLSDFEIQNILQNIDSEFIVERNYKKDFKADTNIGKVVNNSKIINFNLKGNSYKKIPDFIFSNLLIDYQLKMKPSITNFLSEIEITKKEVLFSQFKQLFYENTSRVMLVDPRFETTFDLKGLVTEEDIPVVTKLFIYERLSGLLIGSTTSNKDGIYVFRQLDKNLEYIITSYDRKYQYKSIIQDYNAKERINGSQ